jgi:hypothetical protein
MIPNFFIVGAAKSGTTALYHYLRQHPAIYMSPIKEPCFFAPEVVDFNPRSRQLFESKRALMRAYLDGPMDEVRMGGFVLEWEQYVRLFRNVTKETAIGEASGSYLPSSTAPEAIRERIPAAKIVMMLRNPVDRVYSQYVAAAAEGITRRGFAEWSRQQARKEEHHDPPFGPIWIGRYAEHLGRFRSCFPPDQIRVCFYDDYKANPKAVLRDVFSFLGVDADYVVDTRIRHNVTLGPRFPGLHAALVVRLRPALARVLPRGIHRSLVRWYRVEPARPSPDERKKVTEIYRQDIRELEVLTGRDLSGWL